MNKDYVYIFDKITFERKLLGEIQTDFDMGLTIDGSKDSVTILVKNYSEVETEPYSICWHEKTNTWWVVSHDKVERRLNYGYKQNNNKITNYVYIHNIDLLGAIELCNARDLTDCGFNDNTYTIRQFFNRLISLSTFEYTFYFSANTNSNLLDKKVEYIKTFENYTLLSAIREFLDGYNCCAKLNFSMTQIGNKVYIDSAEFDIIQKTGNASLQSHDISEFDDVRETKTMDKNSFGTCVVSNANNVISTQEKIYPAAGLVGLTANEYNITFENGVIRLPSNVYDIKWIKLIASKIYITVNVHAFGSDYATNVWFYYDSEQATLQSFDAIIDFLDIQLQNNHITQEIYDEIVDNKQAIIDKALKYCETVFHNGVEYNADGTFTKPDSIPYIPEFDPTGGLGDPQKVALFTKEQRDCLEPHGGNIFGIYWERGSNLIKGFNFLKTNDTLHIGLYTEGGYLNGSVDTYQYAYQNDNVYISIGKTPVSPISTFGLQGTGVDAKALFVVNYIPMCDMKIKADNTRDKRDIQIYNQNGKLSDSYALSKLINSFAKEISSDTITRYMQYRQFSDVPKVGSFVSKGKETYVINTISMRFKQNESNVNNNFGYFIDCEFTLSKWVSTKSLMVSPNSNIRDYGIPQNYNVKRKQLYRDYYELAYTIFADANQETPYLGLDKTFLLKKEYSPINQYSVFIKAVYDEPVGGDGENLLPSDTWYYQLECSSYVLNKQVMVVCDFLDNNIIGYSYTNRNFVFDVSNLFNQNSLINTPISYVDYKGKVKDFELLFIEEENRSIVDAQYYEDQGYQNFPDFDALITQVFIPKDLYDIAYNDDYYDFKLDLENYNKDATEVPVFEYACQLDDSEDILIGDNVFQQYADCIYFYTYVRGNNLNQNNVVDNREITPLENPIRYRISNAAQLEYRTTHGVKRIYVKLNANVTYNREDNTWSYGVQENFVVGDDYAIFRHSYNLNTGEEKSELLFIAKNVPNDNIVSNELFININHYKLS